jgi:hypothetical protein
MKAKGSANGRSWRYRSAGIEKQVVERFAVAVVVEAFAERLQLRQLVCRQIERRGGLTGGIGEVVAECPGDRPRQLPALQMPIDQQAGADVGIGVDMRFEVRMRRDVARLVVVEVAHLRARGEQPVERVAVLRQRDVEHGDAVARPRPAPASAG